jgi:hypothetical protein
MNRMLRRPMLSRRAVPRICWGEPLSPPMRPWSAEHEHGGAVRKGERGKLVGYANSTTRTETAAKGEEIKRNIPFLKGYTVFNAE